MKIEYKKENKNGFRQVNFYQKESEKKDDTQTDLFLNYKREKKLNRRKFVSLVRATTRRALTHKIEKLSLNINQIKD